MMLISKNKLNFLNSEDHVSELLHESEIQDLIYFYNNWKKIKIIYNTSTDYGRSLLKERNNEIDKQYSDDEFKYGYYILDNWTEAGNFNEHKTINQIADTPFKKIYEQLANLLSSYLSPTGELKSDLNETDIKEINKFILNNIEFKAIFDEQIISAIEINKAKNLSVDELKLEIEDIKKNLKVDDSVGYVFTGSTGHTEVFIITKNKDNQSTIIKPILWSKLNDNITVKDQYGTDLNGLLFEVSKLETNNPVIEKTQIHPQAGYVECATLGLMYLKQLLKNNADQLINLSLKFKYWNKYTNQWSSMFFPSPQVLLYSQSSLYNKVIQTMLTDDEKDQIIKHKNKTYIVKTIKGLIIESINQATNSQKEIKEDLDQTLEHLSKFREQWIKKYEQTEEKRSSLVSDKDSDKLYLCYSSQRMLKISKKNHPFFFQFSEDDEFQNNGSKIKIAN